MLRVTNPLMVSLSQNLSAIDNALFSKLCQRSLDCKGSGWGCYEDKHHVFILSVLGSQLIYWKRLSLYALP